MRKICGNQENFYQNPFGRFNKLKDIYVFSETKWNQLTITKCIFKRPKKWDFYFSLFLLPFFQFYFLRKFILNLFLWKLFWFLCLYLGIYLSLLLFCWNKFTIRFWFLCASHDLKGLGNPTPQIEVYFCNTMN